MHGSEHDRSLSAIVALAICALVACTNETTPGVPTEPEPATTGALEVTVEVTGPQPDGDGYVVAITPAPEGSPLVRAVAPGGGIVHVGDLPLGTYILRMEGLAQNCSVAGQNPRAFTIRTGATTAVAVTVFCWGPGAILVKTVSRGSEVRTAGYRVTIGASSELGAAIGPNDSLLWNEEDLPVRVPWEVTLRDVPAHCTVSTPNPRTLGALRGAIVRVEYAIACIPPPSRIAFESLGQIYVTDGAGERNLSNSAWLPDHGPSLSPDRRRVVFASDPFLDSYDLHLVNLDGTPITVLGSISENEFVSSQAWSPDGARVVFWRTSGRTSDIYTVNADGTGESRLTHGGWNTSPAWSPDGTWIAFCRLEGDVIDGSNVVYRMRASDGSGLEPLVGPACDPTWSPDGMRIAFTSWRSSSSPDLGVATLDGQVEALLPLHPPRLDTRKPSWSPDGNWIAFNGPGQIWLVAYDAGVFGEPFAYRRGASPSWR